MSKKRTSSQKPAGKQDDGNLTLADALGDSVLSKLKQAKTELSQKAAQEEEEKKQRAIRERQEREANKSFAELLDEYDGPARKY
ncbi:YqkE family protein [Sporosarcina trichiuri]|uniref:YqkE family protein n=1 Tax=Sporosarcina trichiuri TaxID=3056445 RepID=UPI0025B33672|nr:YqkE family protein [Sporosarcina sp. 0.2-SM1T-5]WJY28647.1 YqkE family protein [Sporosarcina sp. 0.2-SM1T-5]